MSTPHDDDALSWGGDEDPTLDVGEKPAVRREPEPPVPDPPVAEAAKESPRSHPAPADDDAADAPDAATSTPLGNAGLIGIGMVAATFLLFAIGWSLAGRKLLGLGIPIPDVTVIAMTVGAALAPIVWFVAVLALTRAWRTWQRFLLLILGIVLLVPWPFLSMGSLS